MPDIIRNLLFQKLKVSYIELSDFQSAFTSFRQLLRKRISRK